MTSIHTDPAWVGQLEPDTLVLANRPLRPEVDRAALSRLADDRWVLTPAIFEDHAKAVTLDFTKLPTRFRAVAKQYVWLLLNHTEPPVIHGAAGRRPAVPSVAKHFRALVAFLVWLEVRGITRLADVTAAHLDAYLGDLLAAELPGGTRRERINEIRRLWSWRQHLPPADRLADAPPWHGDSSQTIFGQRRRSLENRTPRIHPDVMDRLLLWSLRFVEEFADDILTAWVDYCVLRQRTPRARRRGEGPRSGRGAGELQRDLHALLEELRARGEPLPGQPLPDGTRVISWSHLGRLLNCQRDALLRSEAMVVTAGLPIADAAYLDAPIRARLDGVTWRDRRITYHEAEELARHLSTACFVVVAYLSGMRPGEVLTLQRGCVRYDQAAGLWLVEGRHWKGVVDSTGSKLAQGQQRSDPWVVVEPVARAVAVLERLHDKPLLLPLTLSTGAKAAAVSGARRDKSRTTQQIADDITALIAWVNAYCRAGGRLGEQIPPDPTGQALAPSRLRRTLAWHIVRRPRGLVAGAIQYGNVEVQITLGYSGTYASGFPDEHAFETWLLRLEQLADAQHRLAADEHVSGPAARAYRERTHQAHQQFAGRALTSTRQARDLLASPALQVFPAKGMTCVFDPAKAKCRLKHSGYDARRTPDLDDCRPGCLNIARTDHDIQQLQQQAAELQALVADPFSPTPRHQRERHQLQRLQAILDEHQRTRPSERTTSSER